jgi:hypothetical protein
VIGRSLLLSVAVVLGCTKDNPFHGLTGTGSTSPTTTTGSAGTTSAGTTTSATSAGTATTGGASTLDWVPGTCLTITPTTAEPFIAAGDLYDEPPDLVGVDLAVAVDDDPNPRIQIFAGDGAGTFELDDYVEASGGTFSDVGIHNLDGSSSGHVIATARVIDDLLIWTSDSAPAPAAVVPLDPAPWGFAVGDVGDGGSEEIIVVIRDTKSGTVHGVSSGGAVLGTVAVGAGSEGVAVADFDENGLLDFISADRNDGAGTMRVGFGNGEGDFNTGPPFSIGGRPIAVASGDLNADGHADFAAGTIASQTVVLGLGDGDGTFESIVSFDVTTDWPHRIAVADLQGDGYDDAVVVFRDAPLVRVYWGGQDVGQTVPRVINLPGNGWDVALGDLNEDGYDDVLASIPGPPTQVCPFLSESQR